MGVQNYNVPRKNNMVISLNVLETGRCPAGQRTVKEMKICQCCDICGLDCLLSTFQIIDG